MRQKKFQSLADSIKEEMTTPCDMCGKVRGFRAAASHTPFTAYNGKTIYVNTTFTISHLYLGFTGKNKFAGICPSCSKMLHIKTAFWSTKAKLKYYLKFWNRWGERND